MLSVSMEYKILVREIDIKSVFHVKNAILVFLGVGSM